MDGRKPIVLRIENHQFHEHLSMQSAYNEARRLMQTTHGECVVYVPVFSVKPPQPIEEKLTDWVQVDDLPF